MFNMYLLNTLPQAGFDTRSIFKWSWLEFRVFLQLSKTQEHSLPNYLSMAGGEQIDSF